jgi:hypothetical protein
MALTGVTGVVIRDITMNAYEISELKWSRDLEQDVKHVRFIRLVLLAASFLFSLLPTLIKTEGL